MNAPYTAAEIVFGGHRSLSLAQTRVLQQKQIALRNHTRTMPQTCRHHLYGAYLPLDTKRAPFQPAAQTLFPHAHATAYNSP